MITADTSPIFPACPTFGFTSEPMYRDAITQRDSGREFTDRKWARPLHRYQAVNTNRQTELDIQDVLYFWHVLGGRTTRYRFKDWADYRSAKVGETIALSNYQPLVVIDATHWQLTKRYSHSGLTQDRKISRPVGSTVKVYNELGAEQVSSKWTLNEATGVLTKDGTFTGTPTAWSGEFYAWCRFDAFLLTLDNHKVQSIACSVCEVRE